ncbi:MAG: cysteine desulfurase NifS [Clostridiales bacterium]|nr:cysteine desulfurase NifS [Clostridiales bacterium]MDD6871289.1 cysteine desulfurase NifS [Clostridiales bacterium]MDY2873539.1 cysteine desulfurase NifS [Eubacteriales bacterium]
MNRIYMDNAATTRVTQPVLEAMMPCLTTVYGNPSSVHAFGRDARRLLDEARAKVAAALNAKPNEIYFTGCGTESDNWAVRGSAYALKAKGNHIITSAIEHHAILHTCQQLEREGFKVTYLPVDEYGQVSAADVEKAITPETTLISIMTANNEIGTIQPIAEIGAIARAHGVRFHTDAVQAVGAIPVDVKAMNVDLLSLSGHKLHAPKGVGALYIRSGVRLERLMNGGAQERTQRPGTENMPSIVGLGRAIELATAHLDEKAAYVSALRDRLINGILETIPDTRLNGHPTNRLPGNCNVSIRYIEGESMLLNLDIKGIAASSGSACTSGSLDPSHVLLAIGLTHEVAHGSLRFSLNEDNTEEEVDYVIKSLDEVVRRLRAMSPLTM